jgi:L-alanine-DL-glutamate epimerase-like enolase superfamily enzyme
MKVAAMAQARNVPIANGGAFPFHNGHLHAGLAHGGLVEWHLAAVDLCRRLFRDLPVPGGASMTLTDRPGLGFELDRDAVREFAGRPLSAGHGKG